MRPIHTLSACMLFAAALAGCSTPSSRIKQSQALFDTFAPEAQEKIRSGQVEIGFTREMVDMALGAPNRVYTRHTAAADLTVLAYTAYESQRDRQRVRADFRVRESSGAYRTVRDWVWVDVEHRNEYDQLRVELLDGKVTAIERMDR